jgi:hypothetical protein
MLETNEGDPWLTDASKQDGAQERPRYRTRKVEMVIAGGQAVINAPGGYAIYQDVVSGLDVKGLLDLGVGCYKQVYNDQGRY